jgi:hypothetical protein
MGMTVSPPTKWELTHYRTRLGNLIKQFKILSGIDDVHATSHHSDGFPIYFQGSFVSFGIHSARTATHNAKPATRQLTT